MASPVLSVVAAERCPDCLTIEALVDADGVTFWCAGNPCGGWVCQCVGPMREPACEHLAAALATLAEAGEVITDGRRG